ncbi:sigma-70 family RNA polymerase sigma factor [Wenzhouxiangella sp. XN79A]|uniref:ECF-type sigma factor n=1 Tax=Wenzhouxiangella sp. XN79A TaxID=2724193 RepID=UPI00144AC92B|nr:sigma-70 family RNA polymerase sigma factor [Wenzhouxiangella sp. XN79A]
MSRTSDPSNVDASRQEITRLLEQWGRGDRAAGNALLPLVYDQLHRLAKRLTGVPAATGLQPTELIAEAWLKLDRGALDAAHRRHFFALSARVMRQVLVDQARRRAAAKRGGDWQQVTLHTRDLAGGAEPVDLLALDEGLEALARLNPRAAEAVDLHYFGDLDSGEIAEHLQVSERTVQRDLRVGRAWLKQRLADG